MQCIEAIVGFMLVEIMREMYVTHSSQVIFDQMCQLPSIWNRSTANADRCLAVGTRRYGTHVYEHNRS